MVAASAARARRQGYLEKNIEYFSPPYLYAKDGSGSPAVRPVIDSAPATTGYAQTFAISTQQAGSIGKVGLVRLGAPTHSEDQGQRYVPLAFSASGSALTVTAPATRNIAPPGYYMLFVTNTAGVPSVAKIVKLDRRHPGAATRNDYNGDKKTDIAVWRPSTGVWSVRGISTTTFGVSTDKPVQADYDGDWKTDIAVWRPSSGAWYCPRTRLPLVTALSARHTGPGRLRRRRQDRYRGVAAVDRAVVRPRHQDPVTWGVSGDKPVPADYNGDGKADLAVWRPSTGTWYVRGISTTTYGVSTDKPVHADYDGDGKTDIAVWRPSTGQWYVRGKDFRYVGACPATFRFPATTTATARPISRCGGRQPGSGGYAAPPQLFSARRVTFRSDEVGQTGAGGVRQSVRSERRAVARPGREASPAGACWLVSRLDRSSMVHRCGLLLARSSSSLTSSAP